MSTGSTIRLPSGGSTDTALSPGQIAPFLNFTDTDFVKVNRLPTWPLWDEAEGPGSSSQPASWRTLTFDQWSAARVDPKHRGRLRNQAIDQFRKVIGE
jgi:hypothetical protein